MISYQTILAAKIGNSDALTAILSYYAPYIAAAAKRPFYDDYGNRYEFVDEEMRQQIESKLMLQIVYKFNPYRLPDGETLEPDK